MRTMLLHLIAGLSLLALVGCQPTANTTPATPTATPRPTISPTPAPVQVNLYGLSEQNTVVALNPTDGSVRWQHPVPQGQIVTFQVAQDTVLIETDQTLMALNASDGQERWQISNTARLLMAANGIALTLSDTALFGLSTVDGQQLWSYPIGQGGMSARIIGEVVYASLHDGLPEASLHALGARDGKERWSFQHAGEVQTATPETVYMTDVRSGSSSATLFALNQSNGQERWHVTSPGPDFFVGPTETSGVVYVALDGHNNNGCGAAGGPYTPGTLYALRASDGTLLWHTPPPQAGLAFVSPVVEQGVIYSADEQSAYAFTTAGQHLWSSQLLQSSEVSFTQIHQPILSDRFLYLSVSSCSLAGTVPVSLWVLEKSDGHVVWRYQGSQPFANRADPLVLHGVVYVPTAGGGVEALNGSDGKPIWQYTSPLSDLTSNTA